MAGSAVEREVWLHGSMVDWMYVWLDGSMFDWMYVSMSVWLLYIGLKIWLCVCLYVSMDVIYWTRNMAVCMSVCHPGTNITIYFCSHLISPKEIQQK